MVEPALLSRTNAARFLALSLRSFDELVRRHEVRPVRVPGMRRCAFRVEDLRAAVARWGSQSKVVGEHVLETDQTRGVVGKLDAGHRTP